MDSSLCLVGNTTPRHYSDRSTYLKLLVAVCWASGVATGSRKTQAALRAQEAAQELWASAVAAQARAGRGSATPGAMASLGDRAGTALVGNEPCTPAN